VGLVEILLALRIPLVDPTFVCTDARALAERAPTAPVAGSPSGTIPLAGYILPTAREHHHLAPAMVDVVARRAAAQAPLEWGALSLLQARALVLLFAEHHQRETRVASHRAAEDASETVAVASVTSSHPPGRAETTNLEAASVLDRTGEGGEFGGDFMRPAPADFGDCPIVHASLLHGAREAALKRMPLFETMQGGGLVALAPQQRHLLSKPHPFFTPRTDEFISPAAPPAVLSLLRDLGVTQLGDADVFAMFLLPAFAETPVATQEAMRTHLLSHWTALKQSASLCAALASTPFVPTSSGLLLPPSELLDPRDNLFAYIFGGGNRFPTQQYCSEEWLGMLGSLGMKTKVDRGAFLQCARKVEALGRCEEGCEEALSPDVLAKAALLATHLIDNLAELVTDSNPTHTTPSATNTSGPTSGHSELAAELTSRLSSEREPSSAAARVPIDLTSVEFCAALKRVQFLPSHLPSATAAPHGGPPTLSSFESLALDCDRSLVWTVAPLLRAEWTPPRHLWPSLALQHPPPASRVLAHYRHVSKCTVDAWPWAEEPVEAVYGALWEYLGGNPQLLDPHTVSTRHAALA